MLPRSLLIFALLRKSLRDVSIRDSTIATHKLTDVIKQDLVYRINQFRVILLCSIEPDPTCDLLWWFEVREDI